MSDINYDFKDLLNVGENFNLLYTQMLNGKRIRSEKTGVVYVFDEVGCGKTVSAIIAIASVIKEKQMENEGYKILVLTQKSVCLQFEEEIKEKLKIDSNVIYNVAYDTTNSLEENIPTYRKEKSCIIVSNPHKIGYLNGKEKRWDLVVIDEAHDLICNNQKQTEAYYTDKINKAYDEYLNDKNFSIERKKYIKDYLNNIDKESSFYNAIYQFVQQIAVEERNEHLQTGRISVPESRSKENVKFRELLNLKSNKLMFLSATPYKNSREMDFINYAFVAAHILTDHTIFAARYLPELDWVQDVYSATEGGKQKMEAANTSFMFKEIAQAIPFDSKDTKIINGKRRIVEIWDSKEDTDILRKNIISKLDKKEEVKRWYDGFCFGEMKDIYNPWSIINYLDKKEVAPYWANTSSNSLIGTLIREGNTQVKESFELLLSGKEIITELDEQIVYDQLDLEETAIWSLLLASGYLKVEKKIRNDSDYLNWKQLYRLKLTNFEVQVMFAHMVKNWFSKAGGDYNAFIKAMLVGDIEAMNAYMNRISMHIFSYFDVGKKSSQMLEPERFYHGFVLGLLVELIDQYEIKSNRESGFGRYDVMLRPRNVKKDKAIIMEFKVLSPKKEKSLEETAQNALEQIKEKKYKEELIEAGINENNIKAYGFAFEGKNVLILD
jgi:hypothetical protein